MNAPRNRITRIGVSNYRSVGRNQVVRLGAMTVLVGPNGSGKSNVVDVLSFVRDAMHMGLSGAITDRGGIDAVRRWSAGRPYNVSIEIDVVFGMGPGSYAFEITGDRREEFRVKSEAAQVSTNRGPSGFTVERGTWHGPEGLEPATRGMSIRRERRHPPITSADGRRFNARRRPRSPRAGACKWRRPDDCTRAELGVNEALPASSRCSGVPRARSPGGGRRCGGRDVASVAPVRADHTA